LLAILLLFAYLLLPTYKLWPGIPAVTGFPSVVNKPFANVFSTFLFSYWCVKCLASLLLSSLLLLASLLWLAPCCAVGIPAVDCISAVTNVAAVTMSSLLLLSTSCWSTKISNFLYYQTGNFSAIGLSIYFLPKNMSVDTV
jgi:hypothetical protein